jgi:hypothetical protein
MSKSTWPFSDPPNVAVVANRRIVQNREWIAYVSHDAEDGAWQFHTNQSDPVGEDDAVVVSLHNIVSLDPTVQALADLPLGWCAWRAEKSAQWARSKIAN